MLDVRRPMFDVSPFPFRAPYSAFRIPHSAFRVPHSAFERFSRLTYQSSHG